MRTLTGGLTGVPGFFTPALQALQFEAADTSGLQTLTDASWQELLAFCDLAHLTLPLMRRCGAVAPEWVITRTQMNLADNQKRTKRIQNVYLEIQIALAAAGIDHLVIKGFSNYPEFADTLEDRMQSDLDLYLPQECIPAAREALTRLGYEGNRTLEKYPADHLPEMTRTGCWTWQGNMYDPDMPPAVDLHFCFWNSVATRIPVRGVHPFWGQRIERCAGEFHFAGLCTTDNLAFCALHILRDLLRGDWVLHHVYELAWFLHARADDQEFWEAWTAQHDDSLRSLQTISFWLARDWFQCRWAKAIDQEVAGMPRSVREWLERFSTSPLTGMFHPNKHGVWLHLALLPSRRDKLLVLRDSLLPFRLPAIGAPGQNASKTRRTRSFWPSQRYARYLFHVVFRAAFHLRAFADTMWRRLCWWLDQQRLRKSF